MIVDGHNDLLLELAFRAPEENPFARYWLPKLRAGGVAVQVCPIYVGIEELPELGLRRALEQVAAFHRAARGNPADAVVVRSAADLDRLDGRVGLILALEGVEPLGYDPTLIDVFWELGVRMVGLTWNRRNPFADGLAERSPGGLSEAGRKLVTRLAERGAIIDLAHASEPTFRDVFEEVPGATIVVSHANCRALVETRRNLSDEQLRTLAASGGLLGLLAHPFVLDPERRTIDGYIDHIDHAVELMGIEHVGIGADFTRQIVRSGAVRIPADALLPDGMAIDAAIDGLEGPDCFPNLVAALERRGYAGDRLAAVLGANWLALLRQALP